MSLRTRVVGLLVDPVAEWRVIADERTEVPELYLSYIGILAAVPAIALIVGLAISAGRYLGRDAIVIAITAAMVGYTISLALPFATALILSAMAPRFKSDGGMLEAFKLVGYASTPFWIAGLAYSAVSLSPLVIVGGLYAIYLLFLGLTPVMGTPADQRVPFTLVAVIATLVLNVALSWIVGLVGLRHYGF